MGRGKRFFSSPKRPDPFWGPPNRVLNVYPRTKRPVHHLLPSDAEVKNEWSYISAPPVFFQGVERKKSSKDRIITSFSKFKGTYSSVGLQLYTLRIIFIKACFRSLLFSESDSMYERIK